MLVILLISTKCERVFSFIKYLVTNSYNCLKADIIEANECLKFWYGCLKLKAFKQGINPNIDNLYKEELAAKATTKAAVKAAAKKDFNVQSNVDQEAGEGEQEGQGDKGNKGNKGDKGNKDDKNNKDNKSQEEDKGSEEDAVKYIVIDN